MASVDSRSSERSFKDHFSGHSSAYAASRPTYPDSLFAFLADCCARREQAWDCATGNGQAARALTRHFTRVVASDASEAQIEAAGSDPEIEFRVARAEQSGLQDRSMDLITVAQALHWFDIARFFEEAQRVLVSGGVLAFWCYGACRIDPDCDALINELYADIVGSYWPPESELAERGYRDIEMPLPSIAAPDISMKTEWTADEMLSYLRTWSASRRYLMDNGSDPVALIGDRLRRLWGGRRREVSWPLYLRLGRS